MPAKVTLVTPPDIFQNNQNSIMLIDPDEQDQSEVADWLKEQDFEINIYYYQGEQNVPWFLHSLACSKYKYINLDNMSAITSYLAGYILSKNNVYYRTADENIAALYSYINNTRAKTVTEFLERIYGRKE